MEESEPTVAESIPREGQFHIQLPSFEGPLDLLLHLIKKHELDILDLPIAFVTERYLEYLRVMRELDLDVAGEYLLMAATLAHIKSKMLLPQVPGEQQDDDEDGEPLDPRLELIRRLLEYQKYKNAAENLGSRAVAGRDVFGRGLSAEELGGRAARRDRAVQVCSMRSRASSNAHRIDARSRSPPRRFRSRIASRRSPICCASAVTASSRACSPET